MLSECVVNVSEGRDQSVVDAIAACAGDTLLDVHTDADHHRSVLTLGGTADAIESAARAVVAEAVARIDLRDHQGVHPRLGAADVVPFTPLDGEAGLEAVRQMRDRTAGWMGTDLEVPCFYYGPERPLPEVRREAFRTLRPDTGPTNPHPTAGASAVGVRPLLVAYNIWLSVSEYGDPDAEGATAMARAVAETVRTPTVRTLGLAVGDGAQVSCNLIDPLGTAVADLVDAVTHLVDEAGGRVDRTELVGLVPAALLRATPTHRWAELDLDEDRTIEARMEARGTPIATAGA